MRRTTLANAVLVILVLCAPTVAGMMPPLPSTNIWRRIGFGNGPGYHAYNCCCPSMVGCAPCLGAGVPHGAVMMRTEAPTTYMGSGVVPGASQLAPHPALRTLPLAPAHPVPAPAPPATTPDGAWYGPSPASAQTPRLGWAPLRWTRQARIDGFRPF